MVFQKINFVYVEEAAIGARKQPRLERLYALFQCALDVDSSAHAVFGRAQRQINDRHRSAFARQFSIFIKARKTIVAEVRFIRRVATIRTTAHTRECGEKVC